MFSKYLFVVCAVFIQLLVVMTNTVHPVITPRPIGNEKRIKVINYMPNSVISFTGCYMYHSIIEFANDENIETITMGTPNAWQIHPAGNRIFLKPVEDDATTNMTVITNKRMYFFEMRAKYATNISSDDIIFMMKFLYSDTMQSGSAIRTVVNASFAPDLSQPDLYNFKYQISGKTSEIEPILIFDDGEFTYFKFRRMNTELPAFFLVNSDGTEGIVNYRVYSGYIIIERVAKQFTLRHGHDVICVFNTEYDDTIGQNITRIAKIKTKKN